MNRVENPLVSIVVPVYNSEKYLHTALDSLTEQTYDNLEILIVNNGSSGNVDDIFQVYQQTYPERKWRLIKLENNVGLFHARLKGWEQATGDYLATIDSDDYISVDFYYQLVKKAQETQSDIVMADYVHDFVKSGKMHYPMNAIELQDVCWEGGEALKQYFQYCGRCFNLHADWNKIYARSLFERAKPYFSDIHEKIVLSEDALYSCIFFGLSERTTNIHNVVYYHVVRDDAESSNIAATSEKIINGFQDQYVVFNHINCFLEKIHRLDEFRDSAEKYKRSFVEVLFNNLEYGTSNMSRHQKQQVEKRTLTLFGWDKPSYMNMKEWVFESRRSPFNDTKERARRKILDKNIKCVSFDIFDTLVERPFLRPDDTFEFLSYYYNQSRGSKLNVDFALFRREAESRVRMKIQEKYPFYREVTLEEIYSQLTADGILSEEESREMMLKEINFEYRFCRRREAGYELYEFAKRCGKTVACISDMYLPKTVIQTILERAGYMDVDYILVSSDERVCKCDGRLFNVFLNETGFSAKQVMHFGDNYASDYLAPRKVHIFVSKDVTYLPSAKELLTGTCGLTYSGNQFLQMFGDETDPTAQQNYLGNRCIAGVAGNHIFKNPYTIFAKESSFDANTVYMGYLNLGSYIFGVAKWLLEATATAEYETIHFIAQDGYLLKQAYDILVAHSKRKCPRSNYLNTSRQAMVPMLIQEKGDIDSLRTIIDIFSYTPLDLIKALFPTIEKGTYQNVRDKLENKGILGKEKFQTINEWRVFAAIYKAELYSEEENAAYRKKIKEQFEGIIGPHDCIFTTGFCDWTERILENLLGHTIASYYLYFPSEQAWKKGKYADLRQHTFHLNIPSIPEMKVIQNFLCPVDEKSKGYFIENNYLNFRFENERFEFQTSFLLHKMQSEAIQFVKDFVATFPDEWEWMPYYRLELPLWCLVNCSTEFDHAIFLATDSNDRGDTDQESGLYSCWNNYCMMKAKVGQGIVVPAQLNGPRWKKAVYLLMYDRKTLKDKVKEKYEKRPALLTFMKVCYAVPRGIYHIFRK